jgi:NAD(P)-dependent dehydrogenase (short-subunit alcohol dehydrogenase family)
MGRAICRRLADVGHRVAVLDLDGEGAEETARAIESSGGTARGTRVDVADRSSVDAAVEEARRRLGPVGILVTSAGIEAFQDFLSVGDAEWDRMIAVNLSGTFYCLQAAVPDMVEAGWGRIVTISSSSAQSGTRRMAHYVASKGGVIGLTKALAVELAPSGITVNTIPPGFIDTPMMRRAVDNGVVADMGALVARTPVGRAGTAEDVAAACAFLCTEEAGYITGQLIGVNGGWYL